MKSLPILKPNSPEQNIDLIRNSLNGNFSSVQNAINSGADINIVDANGISALNAASMAGNLDIVKFLVSNGADLTLIDKLGYDAYHSAMFYGDLKGLKVEPFNTIMSVVKYI
jgi:ankyrin repeat protein